jgi:hypothetical protein
MALSISTRRSWSAADDPPRRREATVMPDSARPIIASNFRWIRKGTLQATADLEIRKWRLKIHGGKWHAKDGRDWFTFPSREWVDRDGARQFAVLLEFTDKDVKRRFKEKALAAIRELGAGGGFVITNPPSLIPTNRLRRLFRGRIGDDRAWLIRGRPHGGAPDVFLRSFSDTTAPPSKDSDDEIAPLWYQVARPHWPAEMAQKRGLRTLKQAHKAIRRRGG